MKIFQSLMVLISIIGSCHAELVHNNQMVKEELKRIITNNVFWARSYIISIMADLPDKQAIQQRLMQNQGYLVGVLKSFFLKQGNHELAKLLQEHKHLTLELMHAIKDKDRKQIEKLERQWYSNIHDVAGFVHKANPKWSVEFIADLLNGLLKLTKQEMVLRAQGKWEEDIKNFDQILLYVSTMVDRLV